MQIIPVKTRILMPPKDDLYAVLDKALPILEEGDIIVISSKVVAIAEGNCVKIGSIEKKDLIAKEADLEIPRTYWSTPLTIKYNAFIGTAGIDESNANGYYVLLPKDAFASAKQIYDFIRLRNGLEKIAVIITDSHSTPFRRGAMGVSIGYWGLAPTVDHVGEMDIFGRELKVEVTNLVDGIAAAANVVMGETNERQPIAIARNVPGVTFTNENKKATHFVSQDEDTFRVLYERFIK